MEALVGIGIMVWAVAVLVVLSIFRFGGRG